MPNGDIVLPSVPALYQRVLRRICDGQYSDELIAHDTLRQVRKDLVRFGEEPIRLIEQMHQDFAQIPTEPLLRREVDWLQATQRLERLAGQADGHADAIELALDAAKAQLAMLRRGEVGSCPLAAIIAAYITRIYEARFAGRIPREQATPEVDGELVHERLAAVYPYLALGIENVADQIARRGSVAAIRMPRRPRPTTPIALDTDLATVGR